MKSASYE